MKLMNGYVNGSKKTNNVEARNTEDRANELNAFYNRFDCHDFSAEHLKVKDKLAAASSREAVGLRLSTPEEEVRRVLHNANPSKDAGPDRVSSRVLKSCSDQPAFILSVIFNLCFKNDSVPLCWKTSCIVPVPKKAAITSMNDLRPFALTSQS